MNIDSFVQSSSIFMAFLATLFTWGMTALGASLVFFFKEVKPKVLNMMLGFASRVMIAASFFSLLLPAEEMAVEMNMIPWPVLVIGLPYSFGYRISLFHICILVQIILKGVNLI